MPGRRLLSHFQLGKEVTSGTPVAATRRMDPDLTSAYTIDWMKSYHEGRQTGYHNNTSYATQQGTRVDITYRTPADTGVNFDQLPFFFHFPMGGTSATSSGGAGGTTYTWAHVGMGGTADGTALSYTAEFGDETQNYEAEYVQASRVRMSAEVGGLTQLEADFYGRQSTKSTKTTLVALYGPRIPTYLWQASFATAASGLAAATAQQNFLIGWDAEWTTGMVPRFYQDGNPYFGQGIQAAPFGGVVNMTVASIGSAVSRFYDKGAASIADYLRLQATSPVAIAGGTAYKAILEFALEYTNVVPLGGETDGENYYTVQAKIIADTTWGQAMGATVVNTVANLSS